MKQADAVEFVKAWQGSKNIAEVSEKLKSNANSVRSRGMMFRKHGVPLKKFKRNHYDWEALAQLAKSMK